MTSTEPYTAVATQARQATEKSVDAFRTGAKTFTDQLDQFRIPTVDLTEPVARYFEYVQKVVDLNRDLATRQAEQAEQAAKAQAEKVQQAKREQAEEAEEAEKAKAREAKRIEREEARKAQQQAREAYEGLTKAELSDQLAERGLPKTGNLDDLIERLVSADSE